MYHVAGADETDDDVQAVLDEVADRSTDLGMDGSAIETRIERDRDVLDAAVAFDAVVMGESDPSLVTFVFGMPVDQVAERFLGPVLVVQHESATEDGNG